MNDSINIDDLDDAGGLVPPPPPSSHAATRTTNGVPQNLQATRSAAQLQAQHDAMIARAQRENRPLVPMPNGELGFLDEQEEFIGDHGYLSAKHEAMVGDALRLIKHPEPGWIYVWAAKYNARGDKPNAMTIANIRSGRYKPVTVEELDQETEVPIESHKIAGHDCAGIVDVLLMGVSPAAQKQLYKWRVFEAKRKTVRWQAYEQLAARVSAATGGQAYAQVERKE